MRDAAMDAAAGLALKLSENRVLDAMDVRVEEAEIGYLELSVPAEAARDGAGYAVGAVAALAEAAARFSLSADGETAELSLHLHGLGADADAKRLIARGEPVRDAQASRPMATTQADVFQIGADGAETLLATALVSVLVTELVSGLSSEQV